MPMTSIPNTRSDVGLSNYVVLLCASDQSTSCTSEYMCVPANPEVAVLHLVANCALEVVRRKTNTTSWRLKNALPWVEGRANAV